MNLTKEMIEIEFELMHFTSRTKYLYECIYKKIGNFESYNMPANLSVSGKHIQCLLGDLAVSETQLVKWEDFFWQLWHKFKGNWVNWVFLIAWI